MQQALAYTFETLSRKILDADASRMLDMARELGEAIPELRPLIGFDQRSPHHAYDLYTHVAYVVAGVPAEPAVRWAALLHDIGKIPTFTRDETGRGHFYGHAPKGAEMADGVLRRLGAPEKLRQRTVFLIANHMTKLPLEKKPLEHLAAQVGTDALRQLVALQKADMSSKGVTVSGEMRQFAVLQRLLEELDHGGI